MRPPPEKFRQTEPFEWDYGWKDWWKFSVTNRILRLICTVIGGLIVAGYCIAGAYESTSIETDWFKVGLVAFAILLAGGLFLDLRLSWSFKRFAARHQAILLVHLVVGQVIGLLYVWFYGRPILRELSWVTSIPAGFILIMLALLGGVFFTLCIGGPSRVCSLCALASVVFGAVDDGFGVLTRIEVWDLLIEVLPLQGDWLTWVWAIVLGLCWFYDRGGGFFEPIDF